MLISELSETHFMSFPNFLFDNKIPSIKAPVLSNCITGDDSVFGGMNE